MMRLVNSSCKPKLEALHTFPLFSILWKRIVLFPDKQQEFAKQIPEVETNTFTVFGFGVLFVFYNLLFSTFYCQTLDLMLITFISKWIMEQYKKAKFATDQKMTFKSATWSREK